MATAAVVPPLAPPQGDARPMSLSPVLLADVASVMHAIRKTLGMMKNSLQASEYETTVDTIIYVLTKAKASSSPTSAARKIDVTSGAARKTLTVGGALQLMEICGFRLLKTRSDGSFLVYDPSQKNALDEALQLLESGTLLAEGLIRRNIAPTHLAHRTHIALERTWKPHAVALSNDGSCIIS